MENLTLLISNSINLMKVACILTEKLDCQNNVGEIMLSLECLQSQCLPEASFAF